MKDQLLQELSLLHEKVAALKVYDNENANLLWQYGQDFEALLTKLLTFDPEKFEGISAGYMQTSTKTPKTVLDVHDDTDNGSGFYASVSHLNNNINDAIETVNSL